MRSLLNQNGTRMTPLEALVLFVMGVIIIGALLWLTSCGKIETPKELQLGATVQMTAKTQESLIQWVYDHSNRISRADCREIVIGAMKTKRPLLMIALIQVESEFIPAAMSNQGAIGLTQVMPSWEKYLITKGIIKERRDLFNISPSIAAGDEILGLGLKDSKGDVTKALDAYLGKSDGYYVKRILANLANLYVLAEASK